MKFNKLPGDFTGGLYLFAILIVISIIELYLVKKAYQGTGGLTARSLTGGGGDAGNQRSSSHSSGGGGSTTPCTRKGGSWLCPEENKKS